MKYFTILSAVLLTFVSGLAQNPKKSEMVNLKGTKIYYEVYGKGKPLFLLHGFTQSSKSWQPFVADYANEFEVYLVDLKGHGRSGMFTEKLSIRTVADELNELIKQLKLDSIHAIGFSFGGDVLFQLELVHPGLVKSMITIGACGSWHAKDFPQWVDYLSYKNISNLPWMKEEQTSDEQIRAILDQMPNYDVTVTDEEMKMIRSRVLLVLGDKDDGIPLEYISNVRKNLAQSSLWILPDTEHSAHKGKNKAEFVRVSKDFFNNK